MELYPYGVAATVLVPLIKRGVVDFAAGADYTPASGDVTVSKDCAASANITSLPTAVTMGNGAAWKFSLSATEMQATDNTAVCVVDAATKAVEDTEFILRIDYGIRSGVAQAGGSTSITLDASASATNDLYTGEWIRIVGGTGAGQTRLLSAYSGTTKVGTVATAWAVNPDSTSVFTIRPAAMVNANTTQFGGQAVALDANNLPKVDVEDWKGAAAAAMSGDAYAYLGTNLGALGANATAISTAVWASGTRTLTSFGTLVSDTATAVWGAASRTLSAFSFSVTVGTNNDKTGYALTSAYDAAKSAASATAVAAIATILSGITSLAQWLGLLAGKQTGDTTALAEIKATGAGSGTYDPTTDSQEALRDRGDAAYLTATGFAVAGDKMDIVNAPNATAVTAIQSGLATHTDATTIESAITALGSPMQAGSSVTVGTNNDKTGYGLASTGLDSISTTAPAGVASNFREMLVSLWRRSFKKSTLTATELKTYADDGTTVLTTQAVSDDGTTQTQGAGS